MKYEDEDGDGGVGIRVRMMEDDVPQAESQKVLMVRMMWRYCQLGRTCSAYIPRAAQNLTSGISPWYALNCIHGKETV